MEHKLKELIEHTSPKRTRKLLENHVDEIRVNAEEKQVTIMLDRKYAFNQLRSREHILDLIESVKKAFGTEYETDLKLIHYMKEDEEIRHFEKDKNVPFSIHYRERGIPYTVHY